MTTKSVNDLGGYATVTKVGADNGDAAATLTVGASDPVQRWDTTLTATRAVTLSTSGAYEGAKFHIVRTGLGAYVLNVGTGPLKAMPTSTAAWCEVTFDGTAWFLSGYGVL